MDDNSIYPTITEKEFNELMLSEKKRPFLVVFTADWLGEGTIMDSIVENLIESFQTTLEFYRIDIESSKNISHQLGIRRLPAIFFFKDGEIADHFTGMLPKSQIEERLKKLL